MLGEAGEAEPNPYLISNWSDEVDSVFLGHARRLRDELVSQSDSVVRRVNISPVISRVFVFVQDAAEETWYCTFCWSPEEEEKDDDNRGKGQVA